jgi:hypothetical protein
LRFVKGNRIRNANITDPIAIGQAERLIILDIALDPLDPATGHGVEAGIDQRDPPGFGAIVVVFLSVIQLLALTQVPVVAMAVAMSAYLD